MPYSSTDVPPTYKTVDLVLCIIAVVIIAAGDSVWESQPPAILQSVPSILSSDAATISPLSSNKYFIVERIEKL